MLSNRLSQPSAAVKTAGQKPNQAFSDNQTNPKLYARPADWKAHKKRLNKTKLNLQSGQNFCWQMNLLHFLAIKQQFALQFSQYKLCFKSDRLNAFKVLPET